VHSLVVTGAPGVGKSTVCSMLARCLPTAAHIEVDELQRMIVSGGQWPSAGTPASHQQLLLRTRNAAAIARNFVETGIAAIIEEVVATSEQVAILDNTLGTTGLSYVILAAPTATVLRRDAGRSKHTAANYLGVESLVHDALSGRAITIMSGEHTADETAAAVRSAVTELPWIA
jgi:adenylate kinase family enzyme